MGFNTKTAWAKLDAEIVRLRNIEQRSWGDIAGRLGVSKSSAALRFSKLVAPEHRISVVRYTSWSKGQEDELFRLRSVENLSFAQIGKLMGRDRCTISGKFRRMTNGRTPGGERFTPHFQKHPSRANSIPQEVLEDRERRMIAPPKDLTSLFFGDPKPGFSALERKDESQSVRGSRKITLPSAPSAYFAPPNPDLEGETEITTSAGVGGGVATGNDQAIEV